MERMSNRTDRDKALKEYLSSINDKIHIDIQKDDRLRKEYYDSLPIMTMGQCPFCGEVLYRTFDPFGLDGDWWYFNWDFESKILEPPHCPHFFLLCGAVDFREKERLDYHCESNLAKYPGPPKPFVYRMLLDPAGFFTHPLRTKESFEEIMKPFKGWNHIAVISQLKLEPDFPVYAIAYFGDPAYKMPHLYGENMPKFPGWKEDINQLYDTYPGGFQWQHDFDLKEYLENGKLRWCDPEDGNKKLSEKPLEKCPFIDLPGEKIYQIYLKDKLEYSYKSGGFF